MQDNTAHFSQNTKYDLKRWLPLTRDELALRGWDELDVILVSGDAYVDHPAFGTAVIGRMIENEGFKVGIIAQPNWRDDLRDFKKFGRPRLFFGVTSGCMDSMVNHYTAHKRRRSDDAYTPGGVAGFRPDYAATVYSQILKKLYPEVPVILGGIEASLRRVTHYDYWSDSLKPTILQDSGADLLVYGMGEQPLRAILRLLKKGVPFSALTTIPQTVIRVAPEKIPQNRHWQDVWLTDHETCLHNKVAYARNFRTIERESNRLKARRILQKSSDKVTVVNPPFPVMTEAEMDRSFDLPYTRMPHPRYHRRGKIPAYEMIKFSITLHRGCFGGCSFCTISAHQGKFIASRSEESILREIEALTQHPDFKGIISDLGGPSANMYRMQGKDLSICERCSAPSCIFPKVCRNLDVNYAPLLALYRKVREHPAVRKAFVASGLRYDLMMTDSPEKDRAGKISEYSKELITHHVSGRLKVAPEHTSDHVLHIMRKPSWQYFLKFKQKFEDICSKAGLRQQLIPYFISSHPGSTLEDMAQLAADTKESGFTLEQVQDFTPTPMTTATEIYYSGVHPYTGKEIPTARKMAEKKKQKLFFFWYRRENRSEIRRLLEKMRRSDLLQKLLGPGQAPQVSINRRHLEPQAIGGSRKKSILARYNRLPSPNKARLKMKR